MSKSHSVQFVQVNDLLTTTAEARQERTPAPAPNAQQGWAQGGSTMAADILWSAKEREVSQGMLQGSIPRYPLPVSSILLRPRFLSAPLGHPL